ncbi:PREDICTED: PHD finger protein MALE MEIOCYTE DEATH 1-like [Nelumbo nucifera]|uniref:PHD finger protein MALE MEIOCYTE DEATH 1-like n=1 Tax=Nelumbo nucifera TaxID=4432 RepID=A0A1U8BB22_NELNU|nr:PREDICTED: PHD finger protein MALE MEIOCYTE DEATH 1-like [Nelumbo nucifera]
MAITVLDACKKRKRKPKLYGFHTFADPGCPIILTGPFRDNIRSFIEECGEIEDYNVEGMPTWSTLLVNENNGVVVPLYTIEESVKHSLHPFCDHCRCVGWSHHFVSKRRYHMIIPEDAEWSKPLEGNVFDLHTHLLHGLIHCNGFGHLLCLNGVEGGSKYLCGREIMDLWDRICTTLRARKITVVDTSKKRSMDLRLLYGVAYGHTWFGRWGYRFCRGSFGVTEEQYNDALEILSSLNLDHIMDEFVSTSYHKNIMRIIRSYRDVSETQLITLRDLFRFMLALKSRPPVQRKSLMAAAAVGPPSKSSISIYRQRKSPSKDKPVKYRKFAPFAANMDSRWPAKRLQYAAEVIVEALKEKKARSIGQRGMSRQDVRDAARLHIGDTGLLDFVLKSLNNFIVGNHIVRRTVNPATRLLEYTIHEVCSGESAVDESPEPTVEDPPPDPEPGADVYGDVVFLYKRVLKGFPESELLGLASRVVLDGKHFMKEWPFKDEQDELLRFVCRFMPSVGEVESELTRPLPPGEVVVVPPYATVGELKVAAEKALRDTYGMLEWFVAKEVEGVGGMEDEEVLFGALESGAHIWVEGSGVDLRTDLRYEGGADNWTVDCRCGARDDDGERMVACDVCEVWQHTRCAGIVDDEAVPALFVCERCRADMIPPMSVNLYLEPEAEYEYA